VKHYLAFSNKTACGLLDPRLRYVTTVRAEVTCKQCRRSLEVSSS
jgi:hypothetical protein